MVGERACRFNIGPNHLGVSLSREAAGIDRTSWRGRRDRPEPHSAGAAAAEAAGTAAAGSAGSAAVSVVRAASEVGR